MGVSDASLNMKIFYLQHTEFYNLSQEVRRERLTKLGRCKVTCRGI